MKKRILGILFFSAFIVCVFAQKREIIQPGEIWPDVDGNHIQAHGGGIIKIKKTYFWYGEQRSQGLDSKYRYVSCYSSEDLINWKFRGNVLKMLPPDSMASNWILERPKVYYNQKTNKYVMYFHLDDAKYRTAQVGIAVCNKPDGDFKYVRRFRPLGCQSRDIGQFIDDDGSAYLVFEDRPTGFHIAKLSDDYMDIVKDMTIVKAHMEGGAIVHYEGLYYSIGSELTGWRANPNKYATAPSLEGPWTEFKDIAPAATNTYGSQSTMLIKVVGSKKTTVIFMGDQWRPKTQWDSRYLWMPLEIGNGKLILPQPNPWKINLKTGEATGL
ncbi:family 43 glycosylhydrolase [Parabacteroides sp. FAFU027]|uniref:family 43 glycosylhydrolase n=1 Tax=Parabacteroides sp. FAFU027 TaxID=2922715 RepID=UPI001FAFEA23|nr:family 43 glycosylhydrolase [Parabacteroides sp. FAFU027]